MRGTLKFPDMPLSFFAEDYVNVTVLRGGGRDAKGNPLPVTEIPLTDCIFAPRATEDPQDRSDVTDARAVLYRKPPFAFQSTDRIKIPAGARGAGTWSVDGDPKEWPEGSEVGLVRA